MDTHWRIIRHLAMEVRRPLLKEALDSLNPKITLESSRCVPSALFAPRYIRSRINFVETVEVFFATSSASSSALATVASGVGRTSEKRLVRSGWLAG
jgi:hypothetical protein